MRERAEREHAERAERRSRVLALEECCSKLETLLRTMRLTAASAAALHKAFQQALQAGLEEERDAASLYCRAKVRLDHVDELAAFGLRRPQGWSRQQAAQRA